MEILTVTLVASGEFKSGDRIVVGKTKRTLGKQLTGAKGKEGTYQVSAR
jgi:hypothetical protein